MSTKYEAVLKDLSKTIATMSAGDRLPSESELAEQYSVSNMTVRRALQVLSEAKRIVGVRGKGTFVTQQSNGRRMNITSFTESMRASGMTATADVLSATLATTDPDIADLLEIAPREKVVTLVRLRYGDDVPLCIDRSSLRAAEFPGLLGHDLTGSLYALLRRQYGIEPRRASSRIAAVLPTNDEAQLLHITNSTPCIRVISRSMSDEGHVVETTTSLYRGDRYELTIEPESSPRGLTSPDRGYVDATR